MAQFYFAWVDATETTFGDEHKREDEKIFSMSIHQSEGDFASLELTIINPRIGLLAPGRKLWAWLAYEHPTLGTTPLFFGRLIGVPDDLQNEQVQLNFTARPDDFQAQKEGVAASLKVAPYWDPIWFSPQTVDDPDNVLESRADLWHVDRRSLVVTTSSIINGEDGTIALDEGDTFYDGTRMHYGSPPVRHVNVSAQVSWNQKATGSLNITPLVLKGKFLMSSYTGEGMQKAWPQAGKSLGGGWTVAASKCDFVGAFVPETLFEPGYEIPSMSSGPLPFEYFIFDSGFQPHGGLLIPCWNMAVRLDVGYDVSRQKTETLAFTLSADVQSVLTEPGDEEVLDISLSSSELTEPVDPSGLLPIRDQAARSYLTTDRGQQSVEYLIMLARARLLARSRCVYVDIEVPFDDALVWDITCRKNIALSDSRFPGGIAAGKIMEYSLQIEGDTGASVCSITFGCTVGHGGTVTAIDGTPTYCDDDYVEHDYQQHAGAWLMPVPGEIIYTPINGEPPNDDGIDFFRMNMWRVVKDVTIHNSASEQGGSIPFSGPASAQFPLGEWSQFYLVNVDGHAGGFRPDYSPTKALEALNNKATTIDLSLVSLLGGPFQTDYVLGTSELKVPKTIDLEASS